ncbi:MAG: hypothetical protein HOE80_04205 [Candidatus Magasanikbacteria bacterium]|nr:hypothetical protein [Candidatus Magasanikbacteria bacterium]
MLYYIIETFLKSKSPVIVETYFHPVQDRPTFLELQKQYNFNPIEINCITDVEIRKKRFIERNESGNRHAGHVDHENYNMETKVEEGETMLDLGGTLFSMDTNDFDSVDYDGLFSNITRLINPPPNH